MTARDITNGDVTLATECFGDPSDPAVVLVMGATASMLWWPEPLVRAIAGDGFFVIRYDNRDTGRSTRWPPGQIGYTVEDMAGDLLAVMDGYGLGAAHVAGMSLGGLIAQVAALTAPERVLSLSLIGAEPLGWTGPELPGITPEFMAHFETFAEIDWSDPASVADFMLDGARLSAGSGGFDETAERRRIEAEIARSGDMRSAFNHGMLTLRADWSDCLDRLDQPVLILHGADDPIAPRENLDAFAESLPHVRIVVLEGVGHELPDRALATLAEQVTGFVREVHGAI
ncbi:alpha/beta fold hydrolase [Rhodobacterales bacterium HKCCE2091]|nr:alpha/beta fold hydrolase [Rhodobacterales bacterium HKCCE2091]